MAYVAHACDVSSSNGHVRKASKKRGARRVCGVLAGVHEVHGRSAGLHSAIWPIVWADGDQHLQTWPVRRPVRYPMSDLYSPADAAEGTWARHLRVGDIYRRLAHQGLHQYLIYC